MHEGPKIESTTEELVRIRWIHQRYHLRWCLLPYLRPEAPLYRDSLLIGDSDSRSANPHCFLVVHLLIRRYESDN